MILLLGTYLKDYKSAYNRCTWIPMFKAALFTITKLWNQPKCPLTDEQVRKMLHIYTMD
jgi:hypothetical protein